MRIATAAPQLPTHQLGRLVAQAANEGFIFARNDDLAAFDEFLISGMELHDYQQDFVVNDTVRVSFFTADNGLCQVLEKHVRASSNAGPNIAPLEALFRSKALVSAMRTKSRNHLDLYMLITELGFTEMDYLQAFRDAGMERSWEAGMSRLCAESLPSDEGSAHLMNTPPCRETMVRFFKPCRSKIEQTLAAE